jgi:hypothetical protein
MSCWQVLLVSSFLGEGWVTFVMNLAGMAFSVSTYTPALARVNVVWMSSERWRVLVGLVCRFGVGGVCAGVLCLPASD